jgi:hypothetical protein
MSFYGLSQRTSNGVAAAASWEVRSAATNKPRIMEIGCTQFAATAGVYGIGRPAAIGLVPTTPQNFVNEDDAAAPTSLTTAAVAWGTPPTVPANFNRRVSCTNVVGVGFILTFPRGVDVLVSQSIVVWIIATAPVCDVWSVVSE